MKLDDSYYLRKMMRSRTCYEWFATNYDLYNFNLNKILTLVEKQADRWVKWICRKS